MAIFEGPFFTGDGTFELPYGKGNARVLACSGNFDGATIALGYINAASTFIGFKDETETPITFTSDFQVVQEGGIGMKYAVEITGSGASTKILNEQFELGR